MGFEMVVRSLGWLLVLIALAMPGRARETTSPSTPRADGRAVTVTSRILPIEPAQRTIGTLRHLSALVLTADDEHFGGFSGLVLNRGQLTAISDRGQWWTAQLALDAAGALRGVRDSRMGPLSDLDGTPVAGRDRRDAEELLRLPDDEWLVSFEGDHRIWRYAGGPDRPPTGRPTPVPGPAGLTEAEANSGLEAMARLADDRVLLWTEDLRDDAGAIRGWLGPLDGSAWQPLGLVPTGAFKPTGAAGLADGSVLLVERSFDIVAGVRIRLAHVATDQLVDGATIRPTKLARLLPEHHIDNIEAVAVDERADGTRIIYLLSDDNFRQGQRTVLLQLAWYPN